jgi:hypothetical protein
MLSSRRVYVLKRLHLQLNLVPVGPSNTKGSEADDCVPTESVGEKLQEVVEVKFRQLIGF